MQGYGLPKYGSICHLRIEDTRMKRFTAEKLAHWLQGKSYLRSFGLNKVKYEDKVDFLLLMDSLTEQKRL
jgi:hypothetical protein